MSSPRLLSSLVGLTLLLSGCIIFHPYQFEPQASKADAAECRKHCGPDRWHGARSSQEADETNGACWLACSSANDPWYIEERDRRNWTDEELLSHGFCRQYDSSGKTVIDPKRGEVVLYHAVNLSCN